MAWEREPNGWSAVAVIAGTNKMQGLTLRPIRSHLRLNFTTRFQRKNNINACVWKTQFIQIDIIKLTQDSLIADWITMFEYSKAHYSKSGLSLKNFKMATPVWNCLHGIREHWVCHVCLRIVSLLFDFATKNKFAFGDYFLPFSRQMAT